MISPLISYFSIFSPRVRPKSFLYCVPFFSLPWLVDDFERNHILEIRPSVTLAKNVKRKDLVFALLNREIIEAMWGQLIGSNGSE